MVGSTIDELIGHQPSLKQPVLDAILEYLKRIDAIGSVSDSPVPKNHFYCLQSVLTSQDQVNAESSGAVDQGAEAGEVVMQDAQPLPTVQSRPSIPGISVSSTKKEKEGEKEKDGHANNTVLLLIDVACRVSLFFVFFLCFFHLSENILCFVFLQLLESILQNVAHCQDFITMGALDVLLGLIRSPCIPYDFSNTPASDAFASTIRVLTETLPRETCGINETIGS